MKLIGITGGVGAGKSTVLHMLQELCDCKIIMADDVAKGLMDYGNVLSADAVRLFGKEAYLPDHSLNRNYIASKIYQDHELCTTWSNLVHPATNKAIKDEVEKAKSKGVNFCFIEAALLIENHYDEICDEIWYVYASAQIRKERLMADRQYSEEKIASIDAGQLSDSEFRKHCDFVIDTGKDLAFTRAQLENKLEQYS